MKPEIHWIPGPWPGRLGILLRPRGGDWLSDEVRMWREATGLAARLDRALTEGQNVAVHCRQGVGRSALIAALVLAGDADDLAAAEARRDEPILFFDDLVGDLRRRGRI